MIEALAQGLLAGWIGRLIFGGLAVITSLRYGTGLYFWRVAENLERPSYEVIKVLPGKIELRRYDSYLIAETTVDKPGFRESTGEGFKTCAGYIFGKNKPLDSSSTCGEKMAMTAPVRILSDVSSSEGDIIPMTAPVRMIQKGSTKVSFVIGKKYSLKTVPKPVDKNIKLRQVAAHTLAVKSFSGPPPKDDRVMKERMKLEKALLKENIKPKRQDTLVYGYHDPFLTPNFLRRNEVALVID